MEETAREAFEAAISTVLPDSRIDTMEVIGRGWDNTAFLINGELVFRLPNDGDDSRLLLERRKQTRAEVNLLRELKGKLPIAIPDPVYVEPDFDFYGYPYLPGEPLEDRTDLYATDAERSSFVQLWLSVVTSIERIVPVDLARRLGLEPFAGLDHRLQHVQAALESGVLPPAVIGLAEQSLHDYASLYEKTARLRAIAMHGDLGMSQWLVDNEGRATAVIDWTDACIAPVEHELADWYWVRETGAEYVERAARGYGEVTGYQPDQRLIDLDHWANAVSDVGAMLASGAEQDDVHVQGVLKHLERVAAERGG